MEGKEREPTPEIKTGSVMPEDGLVWRRDPDGGHPDDSDAGEPTADRSTERELGRMAMSGVDNDAADRSDVADSLGRMATEQSEVTVEPVDRPGGPYSVGPDHQPSPELWEQVERHRPQGDNHVTYTDGYGNEQRYQFEGTCGLASGAQALSHATGREITEQDLLERATESRGLVGTVREPPDGGTPASWGATNQSSRDRIYKDFGVTTEMDRGWTADQLAERTEGGDSVLASVNSGDLWNPDRSIPSDGGTDHVVHVVGTERDADGGLTGFVVNDTGVPGGQGAGVVHDRATFERAWEDRGGRVNVIVKERSDNDR